MRIRGYKVSVTAQIGIVVVLINLFVALFAPLIAPFDQATPVGDAWADPSAQHWLGLDNLGRDILSRLIYGARMSIGLSLVITALSFLIGVISGFAAAVAGGWIDQVLSRLVDLLLSMPTLIFAFVILSVLGSALPVLICHHRHPRFDQGLSSGAIGRDQHRQPRIRRGGAPARRGLVVDRHPRDPAQRGSAADRRVRPAFLLHLPLHRRAELSRARRSAARRRLGQHGQGLPRHDQFRLRGAALSRSGDRDPHHRRQFRRRLDALDPFQRPGRRRMSQQSRDRLRTQGQLRRPRRPRHARRGAHGRRRRAGAGRRCVAAAAAGRGDRPHRRIRRRQVDDRPRLDGLHAPRLPHRRRQHHFRRHATSAPISLDERRALRGPKIAYIAQSAAASFNPAHTLMEQVCEASVRHGVLTRAEAQAEAISLFKQLDLPSPETIGARYPHQVSGGQLQRVMAAMAMVAKPDILIFDEPTTALDVTTQVECLAAFRKLIREHGTAALYITHDLAVVAQIADRIMVLRRGKMVEFGDSRQILQEPKEEYTRRLVTRARRRPQFRRRERRRPGPDPRHRPRQRQLSRQAEGHRRREPRGAQGRYGRGGRRVGLGQIDPGARRHRPPAAHRRRRPVQRREPAAAPARIGPRTSCAGCR